MRLGAVEYFAVDADQNLATDGDRPSLMGIPFDGPMPGHDPSKKVAKKSWRAARRAHPVAVTVSGLVVMGYCALR